MQLEEAMDEEMDGVISEKSLSIIRDHVWWALVGYLELNIF